MPDSTAFKIIIQLSTQYLAIPLHVCFGGAGDSFGRELALDALIFTIEEPLGRPHLLQHCFYFSLGADRPFCLRRPKSLFRRTTLLAPGAFPARIKKPLSSSPSL